MLYLADIRFPFYPVPYRQSFLVEHLSSKAVAISTVKLHRVTRTNPHKMSNQWKYVSAELDRINAQKAESTHQEAMAAATKQLQAKLNRAISENNDISTNRLPKTPFKATNPPRHNPAPAPQAHARVPTSRTNRIQLFISLRADYDATAQAAERLHLDSDA